MQPAALKRHRQHFDLFAAKVDIRDPESWYNVSLNSIRKKEPRLFRSIRASYNGSLVKALLSACPEYTWHVWKFKEPAPKGFWSDLANHKLYFDWLGELIGVKTLEDWYTVRGSDILATGQARLFENYYSNSLFKALSTLYPQHNWKVWRFAQVPAVIALL